MIRNLRILSLASIFSFVITLFYSFLTYIDHLALINKEDLQILKMSESFTHTYSKLRNLDMEVPATFTRLSFDEFNKNKDSSSEENFVRVFGVGRIGFELNGKTNNSNLIKIHDDYLINQDFTPSYKVRYERNNLISRTIVPSIANDISCVECHNKILNNNFYKEGDMMGVYVVERDLLHFNWASLFYTLLLFIVLVCFTYFFLIREKNRSIELVKLQSRLRIKDVKFKAKQRESFLLSHDTLTGLPNRKLFNDYLLSATINKDKYSIIVGIVDLDDFKKVNDTMGHAVGDLLLETLAHRLNSYLESFDGIAARLGGDEFSFVWLNIDNKYKINEFCESLLNELSKKISYENYTLFTKCSIGIASWSDTKNGKPSEILKLADIALYFSKNNGKNSYSIYNEVVSSSANQKSDLYKFLSLQSRVDSLKILIQPQLSFTNKDVVGFQTTAVWQSEFNSINYGELAIIAGSEDLLWRLDLIILQRSIDIFLELNKSDDSTLPLSIEISVSSFLSSSFVKQLRLIVENNPIIYGNVFFVLNESDVIKYYTHMSNLSDYFNDLGIRLTFDNFGVEYSSINYLLKMQVNRVMVCSSFICETDYDILQYLSDISTSLNVDLIVKNILTEQCIESLSNNSIYSIQGEYFTPLLDISSFKYYLENSHK